MERRLAQRSPEGRRHRHVVFDTGRIAKTQVLVHGDKPSVERDVMRRTGRETVRAVDSFPIRAVAPRFDVAGQQHSRPSPTTDCSAQPAFVLVVVQDHLREAKLPDPHRRDEKPFGGLGRQIRALTLPPLDRQFDERLSGRTHRACRYSRSTRLLGRCGTELNNGLAVENRSSICASYLDLAELPVHHGHGSTGQCHTTPREADNSPSSSEL